MPKGSCATTATPTARRRSCRCRRCSPRSTRARTSPWARASRRARGSGAASRCGAGSPGAHSSSSADSPCASPRTTCSAASSCGAPTRPWRPTLACASMAGCSTPRRSRWPARSAIACARSGSCGTIGRGRACRCRASSCRSSATCWRRAPTCAGRRSARRPSPPPIRRADVVLTGSPRPGPRLSANVRRAGRAELALLAALVGLAVAPLAGLLLRVALRGGHFTGGDGLLVLDQLQYLNWLRQASEHVLVGNLYDLAPGRRSFLHPGVAISGALHALGLGIAAAYLVWKPVAVLALWAGVVAWCHRLLQPGGGRLAAIALALFFASPAAALVGWTGLGGEGVKLDFDFLGGELTSGNFVWGYSFTAIAVGLVPLGLLAHERARTGWAAAAGLVAAWLQPWQGATFLLTLLAVEAVLWRRRGRSPGLGRPAVVAWAGGAAPPFFP